MPSSPAPVRRFQATGFDSTGSAAPLAGAPAATSAAPPTLTSHALLQGHKSVAIEHNGVLYRLHATRLGKLILTK